MPQSNDIVEIRFATKGDQELLNAFKGLAKGQQKFNGATAKTQAGLKKLAKGQQRVTEQTKLLGNAFSVIRSKMLLFSFAMSLGVRQIVQFAKEAAKVDSMETAFTNMSGSVSIAEERLTALKSATNGTMTEFDLFQQANNAMILGLTRNTEEMAEMFDAAQRLGRALGRDTKSSIESLVTGIGRQSRLMLDNIGIIVKTEEAYENYAVSLGTTAASLSDIEKKQAFFNAAMEAAEQKLLILGAEIPTSQDALDSIGVTFSELGVNIGKAFLPMLTSVADRMGTFSKLLTPERVEAYTKVIGALGLGLLAYIGYLKRAIIWQTRTGWGALATAAGFLAAEVLLMSGALDDVEDSTANARAESVAYLESLKAEKIEGLNEQLKKQKEILDGISNPLDAMKERINSLQNSMNQMDMGSEDYKAARDAIDGLHKAMADLVAAGVVDAVGDTEQKKRVVALIAEIEKYQGIITTSGLSLGEFNVAQDKANALYNKTPEAIKASVQANIDFISGLDESVLSIEKQAEVLAFLQAKLKDDSGAKAAEKETATLARLAASLEKATNRYDLADSVKTKASKRELELNAVYLSAQKKRNTIDEENIALNQKKVGASDAVIEQIDKIIDQNDLYVDAIKRTEKAENKLIEAKHLKITTDKDVADSLIFTSMIEAQKLALDDGLISKADKKLILDAKMLDLRRMLISGLHDEIAIKLQIIDVEQQLIDLDAKKVTTKTEAANLAISQIGAMSGAVSKMHSAEMSEMKAGDEYKNASRKKQKKLEQDVLDGQASEKRKIAIADKAASLASASMNMYTGVTKAYAQGGAFGFIMAALVAAAGAVQISAIASTPIPTFATGGSVGGRRHSQGGTMIEAEQGEFVMSRNAVESVGLEAMNRINAGGGAGTVSINFSGNVMSQDFIEDEAIPMIKEAIRRGADIGVA